MNHLSCIFAGGDPSLRLRKLFGCRAAGQDFAKDSISPSPRMITPTA
jgi:hypothetical protein